MDAVALVMDRGRSDDPRELPPEFDLALYQQHEDNEDLCRLSAADARHHYEFYGRAEGRPCSVVDSRASFLALIPETASLLEIGPGGRPGFPRSGRTVCYADVFSGAELRGQVNTREYVPEIDVIWRGEPYRQLFHRTFDAVLAACSLDHQPCLITHLTDVAGLLNPGARYFVVLPDRRYTADFFLPDTSLGDVLEAYAARRTRHSARVLAAQLFSLTHDDGIRHWKGDHGVDPAKRVPDSDLGPALGAMLRAVRNGSDYIDARAWQFTPESFRHLMASLAAFGLSPLRVERVYPTVKSRQEFYAVLRVIA